MMEDSTNVLISNPIRALYGGAESERKKVCVEPAEMKLE
jgi:hypothetical protein